MINGDGFSPRAVVSNDGMSYQARVRVVPIRRDYGDGYYKYSCPVCDSLGLNFSLTHGSDHCFCCGVNLCWDVNWDK